MSLRLLLDCNGLRGSGVCRPRLHWKTPPIVEQHPIRPDSPAARSAPPLALDGAGALLPISKGHIGDPR